MTHFGATGSIHGPVKSFSELASLALQFRVYVCHICHLLRKNTWVHLHYHAMQNTKKTCYSFYFLESFPNVVLRYRNSMEAFKKGF
jgi:hypothetical protein